MKTKIYGTMLGVAMSSVLAGDAIGAITADSTTWEGAYEANGTDTPASTLGFGDFGGSSYSTVAGGVLHFDTIGSDAVAVYEKWPANQLSPTVDFSDGGSLEFRIKINAVEGGGAAMITLFDVNDDGIIVEFDPTYINFPNVDWRPVNLADDFHTFRLTIVSQPSPLVTVYLDNSTTPLFTMTSMYYSGGGRGPNAMLIGDGAGASDADWELDYIRWTDAGALAPVPEPTSLSLLCIAGGLALRRRR